MTTARSFPTEIWEHVFTHACIDGGKTGCAISLVSKYFSAASCSARYRSVSLIGIRRVEAFRTLLMLMSMQGEWEARAAVRHLSVYAKAPDKVPLKWDESDDFVSMINEAEEKKAHDTIARVITALAPSLRHLALTFRGFDSDDNLLTTPMPMLAELELDGAYHIAPYDAVDALLPSLRRLHTARDDARLMRLASNASGLTHFRVDGLYASITQELSDALCAFAGPSRVFAAHFPTTIQRVLLQPVKDWADSHDGVNGERSTGAMACNELLDDLSEYVRQSTFVSVLGAPAGKYRDEEMPLMRCWLERVQGGGGCWSEH